MMFDSDILRIISNDVKPDVGKFLISEPLLCDLYFSRSVVLITDSDNDTHEGFVLNNNLGRFLSDMIDDISNPNFPVFLGGPVDSDSLFYVHKFADIPGAEHIIDDLYIGGDMDYVRMLIDNKIANNTNIKFFLGRSGWSNGQLDDEICMNSWLVGEMKSDFCFKNAKDLWKNSLDQVDKRYLIWKNFPIDPELN